MTQLSSHTLCHKVLARVELVYVWSLNTSAGAPVRDAERTRQTRPVKSICILYVNIGERLSPYWIFSDLCEHSDKQVSNEILEESHFFINSVNMHREHNLGQPLEVRIRLRARQNRELLLSSPRSPFIELNGTKPVTVPFRGHQL